MTDTTKTILLSCDIKGIITKVLQNGYDFSERELNGKLFSSICAEANIQDAIQFLVDIKKNGVSIGTKLRIKGVPDDDLIIFGGGILDEQIVIIGTDANLGIEKFLKGLMEINNEQTNLLRTSNKNLSLSFDKNSNDTAHYFEELTKLNNEMASLQRELSKKNVELLALNNLKNKFLGMAAHDLRNPLGFIGNYCELLEDSKENLTEEQSEFVSMIKSLDNFMLNIVTDLLDISSIESGELKLNAELIDVIKLINNSVTFNRFVSQKKDIGISFKTSIESLNILIDKVKIEQVITNLISNAIKYSKPGTNISVEVNKMEKEVVVSVKDQGEGIEPQELELLFKPFQLTSTKSTAGERSTGLGLYIVKRIVEKHNGKIWVNSTPRIGSTFYFSIPINS